MGLLQQTFNMRLYGTREIIKNVFEVLTVFRIFKKPMEIRKVKAKLIMMTVFTLHNFPRNSRRSWDIYTLPGTFNTVVDGEIINKGPWRLNVSTTQTIRPILIVGICASQRAIEIRNEFASFYLRQNC